MDTLTAFTVTSALEDLLESATLVATTCTFIAPAGAVYRPAWLIDPPAVPSSMLQVTA
jgi:hypothetical protein